MTTGRNCTECTLDMAYCECHVTPAVTDNDKAPASEVSSSDRAREIELKFLSAEIDNRVSGIPHLRINFSNNYGIVIALPEGQNALDVAASLRESCKRIIAEVNRSDTA